MDFKTAKKPSFASLCVGVMLIEPETLLICSDSGLSSDHVVQTACTVAKAGRYVAVPYSIGVMESKFRTVRSGARSRASTAGSNTSAAPLLSTSNSSAFYYDAASLHSTKFASVPFPVNFTVHANTNEATAATMDVKDATLRTRAIVATARARGTSRVLKPGLIVYGLPCGSTGMAFCIEMTEQAEHERLEFTHSFSTLENMICEMGKRVVLTLERGSGVQFVNSISAVDVDKPWRFQPSVGLRAL
jgi:hypothetical protein